MLLRTPTKIWFMGVTVLFLSSMISISLKHARRSTFTRARIGAVIVSGGRVVAKGHNKIRGSKTIKQKRWPSTLHAECDAILNAIKSGCYDDLKNATMFVSHIRPSGTIGMACPCSDCMQIIRGSGKFKKVVFTCANGEIAEIKL